MICRVNVEDEKGKVKVWKRKNYSLHTFSPTRKRIYPPNNIWFRNNILWRMNKRFSSTQGLRTNIRNPEILMSRNHENPKERILGFELAVILILPFYRLKSVRIR